MQVTRPSTVKPSSLHDPRPTAITGSMLYGSNKYHHSSRLSALGVSDPTSPLSSVLLSVTLTHMESNPTQISVVILLIFSFIHFFLAYKTDASLSTLSEKHYQLAWRVSGIEIQSQDATTQQIDMLRDLYYSDFMDAIGIATRAGYEDYNKLVSISGYMNEVHLRHYQTGDEIIVNVKSKTIIIH